MKAVASKPLAGAVIGRFAALAVFGVWLVGGVAAAQAAAPRSGTCAVDVTPSAAEPMTLDVAIKCNVARPLTLRASTTHAAGFISSFVDERGRPVYVNGREWKLDTVLGKSRAARYRFELDAYLNETDSVTVGLKRGGTRVVLLDSWLLQPIANDQALPVEIAVRTPPGQGFMAGLQRRNGRYVLDDIPVRFAGYTAFGTFKSVTVPVPAPPQAAPGRARPRGDGAHVDLVVMDGAFTATTEQLADWVGQTARAIARYFGGFSAEQSMIVIVPSPGDGVPYGRVVPGGGITMMVRVGTEERARALYDEWVLVHEMIHTATPFVYGRGSWVMEGWATYLEPIIRARAGWKREDEVWREWIQNMNRGVQALAVTGLEANASSAGYYWGGALFMLLADIEMRRDSGGGRGLEDCLRAMLQQGGNAVERLSVEETLNACDKAVGGSTMSDLARRYVYKSTPIELAALWRDLGVSLKDGVITYDDSAPLAGIRKLIVNGPPGRRLPPLPLGRT